MKLSICCGVEAIMEEYGICPECLEQCDFECIECPECEGKGCAECGIIEQE